MFQSQHITYVSYCLVFVCITEGGCEVITIDGDGRMQPQQK